MPLFGSDSNIILTEPNKELSSRDLRSRLQNLIKLLQVSIQRRSETQLTTFHLCLVSSAWEEDKVKPNLNLLKSKQPVWRMSVRAAAAWRSEPAGGPERHREGSRGAQLLCEDEGGSRQPLSRHHHGQYYIHQLNITFFLFKRGLLAPDEMRDVDVRAVKKKAEDNELRKRKVRLFESRMGKGILLLAISLVKYRLTLNCCW